MIIYFIKFICCSGLFFLAYLLLLEKEKAHRFKRFYLLGGLLLSLVIPLLTFEKTVEILPTTAINYFKPTAIQTPIVATPGIKPAEQTNSWPYIAIGIYLGITSLLLLRFIRNLYQLYRSIKHGKKANWQDKTLVLNPKNIAPYSFLDYIFVSKTAYENQEIATEILQHELTHVSQKHSLDVIFIELMQIFLWFNPLLYFYRKAIQTNHEYLADENVIDTYQNIANYQMILIQHVSKQSGLTLSSQFNYLTIKKRLIMMSKTTTTKAVLGKQLLLIPLLGISIFLFSTRIVVAQEKAKPEALHSTLKVAGTKEGVASEDMAKYKAIEAKYFVKQNAQRKIYALEKVTLEERSTLESIYTKMSPTQQRDVTIAFIKTPPPLPKVVPTKAQLEAFKNTNEYGVWINEKKVSNTELDHYSATDFKQMFVSRLTGKAKKGRIYNYQVDLMTADFFDNYRAKALSNQNKNMMITMFGVPLTK